MTYQKVVKSQRMFSHQSVKLSSYTSLSDHCNSIPSSRSVIHSEPLPNVNVHRNFGLKIHGRHGTFDVGDLPVPTFGNWVLKTEWLSGLRNYTCVFLCFLRVFKIQNSWLFAFHFSRSTRFRWHWELLVTYLHYHQCKFSCRRHLLLHRSPDDDGRPQENLRSFEEDCVPDSQRRWLGQTSCEQRQKPLHREHVRQRRLVVSTCSVVSLVAIIRHHLLSLLLLLFSRWDSWLPQSWIRTGSFLDWIVILVAVTPFFN